MTMLRPLVKDEELLSVIAQEENIKKIKHRIQSNIVLSSGDNIRIELKVFNKTLMDINRDFSVFKKKKVLLEGDLQKIMKKGYKLHGIPEGIDITGSASKIMISKGLTSIKVKLRFVKGR